MRYASITSKAEAVSRGREVLNDLRVALAKKNLPPLDDYSDGQAAAMCNYSTAAQPKVLDFGNKRGQMVSSINGSRSTRGLLFLKNTRIAGL